MDGFTPTFFLNLVVAIVSGIGTAASVYYAIKGDLRSTREHSEANREMITEERRLREEHAAADDDTFHDIRGELGVVSNRVAVIEGRMERT